MDYAIQGLVNFTIEEKQKQPGDPDDNATADEQGSPCFVCEQRGTDGYVAACCRQRQCADCLHRYAKSGGYGSLFYIGAELAPKCTMCEADLVSVDALRPWVPPEALPRHTSAVANLLTDAEAWNFTIQHKCGQKYDAEGWKGCDAMQGGCTHCNARDYNIVGSRDGHTTQMDGLLTAVSGYDKNSSPKVFAGLKQKYPNAWDTLRLTRLIDALAGGQQVDLSRWDPGTAAFLLAKAAKVREELLKQ